MKRRAWVVAGVVVVLAVGVSGPFWGELWLELAYETHVEDDGVFYLKRAAWLPGDEQLFREQVCLQCIDKNHEGCALGWVLTSPFPNTAGTLSISSWPRDKPLGPPPYRCTCPDASHKDKP